MAAELAGVRRGAPREIQGAAGIRLRREPPAHALRESREGRAPLSYLSKKSSSSSSRLLPLPARTRPDERPVLAHRVDGEGPPLLLLNGGMMSLSAWEPDRAAARRAAPRHPLRLPGTAPVARGPAASMEGHADDVAALLDALGETPRRRRRGVVRRVRRPPPRGAASRAGRVRRRARPSRTCARRGAWARRATRWRPPCGPPLAGGDRTAVYDAIVATRLHARVAGRPRRTRSPRAARRSDCCRTRGSPGLEGLLGALEKVDLGPVLPTIACPVLVLAAERDAAMPLERTKAVADAIPGADLVVVPGSGHALVVEREDEFILLAERFLGARRARPESARERGPAAARAAPRGPARPRRARVPLGAARIGRPRDRVPVQRPRDVDEELALVPARAHARQRDVLLYDYLGQGASDDAEIGGAPISAFGGRARGDPRRARDRAGPRGRRLVRRLRRGRIRAAPPVARCVRSRSPGSS